MIAANAPALADSPLPHCPSCKSEWVREINTDFYTCSNKRCSETCCTLYRFADDLFYLSKHYEEELVLVEWLDSEVFVAIGEDDVSFPTLPYDITLDQIKILIIPYL